MPLSWSDINTFLVSVLPFTSSPTIDQSRDCTPFYRQASMWAGWHAGGWAGSGTRCVRTLGGCPVDARTPSKFHLSLWKEVLVCRVFPTSQCSRLIRKGRRSKVKVKVQVGVRASVQVGESRRWGTGEGWHHLPCGMTPWLPQGLVEPQQSWLGTRRRAAIL